MKEKVDYSPPAQEIGRAEKVHIYVSGIIWLTIILSVVGILIYVFVDMAMID